jgi:hypothetical protein
MIKFIILQGRGFVGLSKEKSKQQFGATTIEKDVYENGSSLKFFFLTSKRENLTTKVIKFDDIPL